MSNDLCEAVDSLPAQTLAIAGLDELISHHQFQATFWGRGHPGADHRKWAALLEKLRQAAIAEIER